MTAFLLKLHCEEDIGGAEPRPTKAEQWEGARLTFKYPSRINKKRGPGEKVVDGDTLIVWTHEDPSYGGGKGLTAEGIARDVRQEPDAMMSARLEQVRLFTPSFRLRGWRGGTTQSSVIDYLLSNLLTRSYELEEAELAEFRAVVDRHIQAKPIDMAKYRSDEEDAILDQKDAIFEGFERRYSRQEVRPDQADFRASLMSRYKGKCAVTSCGVEATLQAAHVIPFSERIALRNELSNGLLLRADIHALFDKALLSIDPESKRVVLSAKLHGTLYSTLKGKIVDPPPAEPYLVTQYRFFKKKQEP